jgi:retron-type reverse transcriptase
MPKNHKQHGDMFDKIVDIATIEKAYKKALKGDGKYNREAIIFSQDETYNLKFLIDSLINKTYEFDGYIRFPVFEPKKRIVDAPHFKDKVVQLAINDVLKDVYKDKFIFDSYACIEGKGTHKCAERIQYFMRKAQWEYGPETTIIKADVEKFFYSIDRDVLKTLLPKAIKCKKTLRLIFKIIDSADIIDLLGLPLGNTLSQICANVYLNELDQYCKRVLRVKYYVRYMDDIIMILPDKETARYVLDQITIYTNEVLNIKLNFHKTKMFPIAQGVNAIGYKIYTTHKLLRSESKKKIKRKIKAMPDLILEGKLSIQKAESMLNSWMGHAGHANSHNFIKSLFEKNDFIYMNRKGTIKIDTTKLGVVT